MVHNRFRIYFLAADLMGTAGLSPAAKIGSTGNIGDFNNLLLQKQECWRLIADDRSPIWEHASALANTGSPVNTEASRVAIVTDAPLAYGQFVEPECPPPSVPEPSTAALAGIGVTLLGLWIVRRRHV